ncbi:MAG: hypothetical protein AAF571_09065 [Verrucomicrobiota bacterium]
MAKSRTIILALLLLAGLAALIIFWLRPAPLESDSDSETETTTVAPEPEEVYTGPSGNQFLEEHGSPDHDLIHDMELMGRVMHNMTILFKNLDTRYVATNEQLSAFLTGENPGRLEYLDPDLPIFKDGVMTDRWGQPYMVHPLGTGSIEVRSIGADGIPYTDDDMRYHPAEGVVGNKSDPNQIPVWDQP